jgi:hypothetical protein
VRAVIRQERPGWEALPQRSIAAHQGTAVLLDPAEGRRTTVHRGESLLDRLLRFMALRGLAKREAVRHGQRSQRLWLRAVELNQVFRVSRGRRAQRGQQNALFRDRAAVGRYLGRAKDVALVTRELAWNFDFRSRCNHIRGSESLEAGEHAVNQALLHHGELIHAIGGAAG